MPIILDGTTGITTPGITNTGEFVFQGPIQVPAGSAASASVTTAAGPDTGIYFPSSSSIAITTAGTEKVSVGTGLVINDGGADFDTRIEGDTDANLFFVDASTDRIGIGTSSPGAKVNLEAADNVSEVRLSRASTNIWGSIQQRSTSGALGLAFNANDGNASTPGFVWRTATDGSTFTEQMVLNTTGLGIGTTSPTAKLDVTGTIKSASASQSSFYLSNAARTTGFLVGRSLGSDDAQNFFIYDVTAAATRVYLTSGGDLGVGTASPGYRLQVSQTSGNDIGFFNTSAGGGGRIAFADGNSGTAASVPRIGANANDMLFYTNTSGNNATERARITSDGYWLVGTTTGGHSKVFHDNSGGNTFQVANFSTTTSSSAIEVNVNYTGNTTGWFIRGGDNAIYRFYIYSNGDMTNSNNSYGQISDVKTKQDIVDAASQWDDIKGLRVRKFRFKADPSGPLQIGVVAQELEQVSPGLVSESPDYEEVEVTDEEGNVTKERQPTGTVTKSVKYSVLYMKAIKALQEAMTRIETLEAEMAALKGSN